jgi:site-specific DNA-methyltransferase (adenine-specific)
MSSNATKTKSSPGARRSPGSRQVASVATCPERCRRAPDRLVPTEPFFEDLKHHIEIYQGDCLQILGAMPAECVDLIFADPPYFLSNGGITCHAGRMVSVNKGAWDRSHGAAQNHEFNRQWLAAAQRVLKPNGSIWVSGTAHVIHSVGFAMQQLDFKLLNDISWVKPNPPPNLSCRYFTHATETIIWAAKSRKSRHAFNYKLMKEANAGKQMKSVWTIAPPETWEKKFGKHPTQKPLALLDRILRASSNEGDLVLDPFMGSGTTILAALRLRRFTIGMEFEDSSVGLALSRVVAELVVVQIGTAIANTTSQSFSKNIQNDLDPPVRFVDRSMSANRASMSTETKNKLVHTERSFYFVGADRREIVFATTAASLEDAWLRFRASGRSVAGIMFVIKTETEIYLAT